MFQTKNVSFKNFIFYNDINIEKSKVHFLVGPSGTGKSTLLKLLNKTEQYSSGTIFYKGKSLKEYDSIELRREVKLVSQVTFLFNGTIRENFQMFYDYCEKTDLSEEKMNEFLTITEGDFSLDTNCNTLSGGERQRVYLAICLSMESEVIMLDEPTSSLDFDLSKKVLGNIIEFAKNKNQTIIVVSHDLKLVDEFAEEIIKLEGGMKNE